MKLKNQQANFAVIVKKFSLRYTQFMLWLFVYLLVLAFIYPDLAFTQALNNIDDAPSPNFSTEKLHTPLKVDVKPQARDDEISERLINILKSTGWFINPVVQVQDGVVFLKGFAKTQEYKKWAEELAGNTQDSVAVVNQIKVIDPSIWDFKPVIDGWNELWQSFLRTIPALIFGGFILIVAWLMSKALTLFTRLFLRSRLDNPLLQRVIVWAINLFIFLIGLYSVFHLMGLTAIALTIIGGTGLLGIILGIAFKEITENLLASIFLSINNPFHKGDLIEIEGIVGYVQSLTVRSTILITLNGNYVQIPNATVYKSSIRNYTSNPNRREEFTIGIGYDCAISKAQECALQVLKEHPAVLKEPEPWVLVDNLGKSTIDLKVYFWLNGKTHSWLKVRSSVIRLIKRTFQDNQIPMPDEAREVIFPKGISVWTDSKKPFESEKHGSFQTTAPDKETEQIATQGEGKLHSEAKEIEEQRALSQLPEQGKNLLNQSSYSSKE